MSDAHDDLLARLAAARGPDREIDAAIHALVFPDDTGAAPEYTRDLPAALMLFADRSPRALCIAALQARRAGRST